MSGSKLAKYGDLTSQQILAVDLLVLKHGSGMSYTEIAELVGVAVKTLERWRKIPEFQKEVRTRTIELMGESLPDVLATLTRDIGSSTKGTAFQANYSFGDISISPCVNITKCTHGIN